MEYLSAKYDVDTLTVDYVAGDGTHLLRTGGTAAWRFNNPGNLRPGRTGALLYGAIGKAKTKSNGSFLIFSSYEEGRKQKKLLLRRKYNQRTIYTMLAGIPDANGELHDGYAPKSDKNDPVAYAQTLADHIGLPTTTKIADLTDAQLESMMDAMERKEGYHNQKDTRREKVVPTTSITVSDGAKPKPGLPAKVQVGNEEHETTTDKQGRLPTIAHVQEGMSLAVMMKTLEGEWKKVYSAVLGAQSKTLALVNPLEVFAAPTAPKKPLTPPPKAKRTPIRYVIESGDTLAAIAKRFKTTVAAIRRDNPQIKDAARIYPAQVISIYGSGAPAPTRNAAPKPAPVQQGRKRPEPSSKPSAAPPAPTPPKPAPVTRSKEGQGAPLALLMPDQKQAPWMQVAIAEARKWGGKVESEITKTSNYHALNGNGFLKSLSGTENAWCGSFVNYCLKHATPAYTTWKNSFRARAVALDANFVEITEPVFGAILLVGTHHVCFVYAKSGSSYVCLGGNQSDQINFSPFGKGVRFFVPLAYHAYALEQIKKGGGLAEHTAAELNTAFGIAVKKKKGNATR
ncbi:LysM peptidoglycan-binding domain-containing protein [Massilia sp. TN1-12]|uniref:LysM peptidoglycan-binding domain-containing protein n=1 Tax=Massilia paldalensis TaxID=3377675 RepID=UPI00384A777D